MNLKWFINCFLDRPTVGKTVKKYLSIYSEILCPLGDVLRFPIKSYKAVILMNLLLKGSFNRPSSGKAILDPAVIKSESSLPLINVHSFTAKSYWFIASRVVILLSSCSPSHVLRGVSTVIINAVNGMFRRRSLAEMFKERRKRFTPFIAYRYAPASVILKIFTIRVYASLDHRLPQWIFRFVSQAVNVIAAAHQLAMKTPTTFGITRTQTLPIAYRNFTANATAFPLDLPKPIVSNSTNNSESSKGLTSHINDGCTSATFRLSSFQISRIRDGFVTTQTFAFPSWKAFSKVWGASNNGKFAKYLTGKIDEIHSVTSYLKIMYINTYMEACQ